jgi:hypothetical protein
LTSAPSTISLLLQQNWSLSTPGKDDIYWADTRVETMDFAKVGKNYVVACYSPSSPVASVPLSREAFQKTEQVVVDLVVRAVTSINDACTVRESMRREVYRIIELFQFKIQGVANAYVSREAYKVESSELARLALQVSCVSFDVIS